MLGNTLIDNSQNLKLVDTLNEIISIPEIQEICIATGYWDLKGTALITESLKKFLEKDETKLRLLIGKDPNVFQKDLTADSYKTAKQYPQDYIKIDLQNVELNNQSYQKSYYDTKKRSTDGQEDIFFLFVHVNNHTFLL